MLESIDSIGGYFLSEWPRTSLSISPLEDTPLSLSVLPRTPFQASRLPRPKSGFLSYLHRNLGSPLDVVTIYPECRSPHSLSTLAPSRTGNSCLQWAGRPNLCGITLSNWTPQRPALPTPSLGGWLSLPTHPKETTYRYKVTPLGEPNTPEFSHFLS